MSQELELTIDERDVTDERAANNRSFSPSDLAVVFPDAFKAYMHGTNVYLIHLNDGGRGAIYFDKLRGCFVLQREGKEPVILRDEHGNPVKSLDQLVKVLKGFEVNLEHAVRGRSRELDR